MSDSSNTNLRPSSTTRYSKSLLVDVVKVNLKTIENSTFHGLAGLLKNKFLPVRLMWFLCIILSTGCCCFSIFNCISKYFEYQVITQIDMKIKNQMNFPLVKICRSDLGLVFPNMPTTQNNSVIDLRLNLNYIRNYVKNQPGYQRLVGIRNLSDIVISCSFNFKACDLSKDFDYYYDYAYGSCYRFNFDKTKITYQPGILNGLQLEFFVGDAYDNNNTYSIENSFQILISDEPIDTSVHEGIRINNGQANYVTINKFSIIQEPAPYSECIDGLTKMDSYDSENYRKTLQSALSQNKTYHFSDCKYMCFQRYIGKRCKCQILVSDPFYADMRKCTNSDSPKQLAVDFDCLYDSYLVFFKSTEDLQMCNCPMECNRVDFSYAISAADYPSRFYFTEILTKNSLIKSKFVNHTDITFSKLKNSITAAFIYYDELKETIVSHEIKMIRSEMLANIGGNLGLFMGISLLSFIEFFEILIQTLMIVMSQKFCDHSNNNANVVNSEKSFRANKVDNTNKLFMQVDNQKISSIMKRENLTRDHRQNYQYKSRNLDDTTVSSLDQNV